MIPRRLKMRNFLSYRTCDVDFSGLHVAVLSGRNGDGKSSLLDGMTWALWGNARGSKEDERIHLDRDEMVVDFEFEVDGDVFAVVRKRTRGKTGELHFYQVDEYGMRSSKTGGTMRETQAEITRAVRMEYDTFLNSAFIAQGRSNEFTKRTPADRKEVFRKLLGLERYELLSKAAKDEQKRVAAERKLLDQRLEEAERELEALPRAAEMLLEATEARECMRPKAESLERQVAELRAAVAQQDMVVRAAEEAEARLEKALDDRERVAGELASNQTELEAAEGLSAEGAGIEARQRELQELRTQEQRLGSLQEQARAFEREVQAAEREIHGEEAGLRSKVESLVEQVAQAEGLAASLPELEAALQAIGGERSRLEEARALARERSEEAAKAKEEAAGLRAKAEELKARGEEISERKAQLRKADALCPVCKQPLGPGGADRMVEELTQEREELRQRFTTVKARAEELDKKANQGEEDAKQLERTAAAAEEEIRRREREADAQLAAARDAAGRVAELEEQRVGILLVLESGGFAEGARARKREAEERLEGLGYDGARHSEVRAKMGDLEGVEEEARSLVEAQTRAEGLRGAIAKLCKELERREVELAQLREEAKESRLKADGVEDFGPRLREAEGERDSVREQMDGLTRQMGQLEEQVRKLKELEVRLAEEIDRRKALTDEDGVYGDLSVAFGRNGVQAMLIDQSLPRVEWTANEMLDRMTGGRIHVDIQTRLEDAAGKSQDTLAIRISDDLGTRDYEMYSGGEAFRVDFALRIALAKLLAERSGASLPTLIIDEGFGTQDEEGIQRLVETLSIIKDEFRLILVVTHLERLKSEFERRIEVTKDLKNGSMARVV